MLVCSIFTSATGPPNLPDLHEFTRSPDTMSAQYHCLTYLFRWGAAHACSLAPFGRERPLTRGYGDTDFFCSKKVFFFLHYFLLKRFGTMEASLHQKASPLGSARTSAFSRLGVLASTGSPTWTALCSPTLTRMWAKLEGRSGDIRPAREKVWSAVEAPTRNGKSILFRTVGWLSPRCGAPLLWRLSRLPPLLPSRLLKVNQDTWYWGRVA